MFGLIDRLEVSNKSLIFQTVQMTSETKVENLVRMIGIKKNRKVVDVTRTFGTAESLTEAKIFCDKVCICSCI